MAIGRVYTAASLTPFFLRYYLATWTDMLVCKKYTPINNTL